MDIQNRGGLIKPATDVIKLCKLSKQIFISKINEVPKHLGNPIDFLIIKTISQIHIKQSLITNCKIYHTKIHAN